MPSEDTPMLLALAAGGAPSAVRGRRVTLALCSGMMAYGELRGFTVITAADGEKALETVRQTSVDAIVVSDDPYAGDGLASPSTTGSVSNAPGSPHARCSSPAMWWPRAVVVPRGSQMLAKPFSFERLEEAVIAVIRGRAFEDGRENRRSTPVGMERIQ